VRSEPGIGKTGFVNEFTRIALERDASCQRSFVLPFGVGKGQDAIHSLVRSLLNISVGGRKAERQQAADNALSSGDLGRERAIFYMIFWTVLAIRKGPVYTSLYLAD
jgi:hypothetical protein